VSGTAFLDRKWPRAEIKFPEVGTLAIPLSWNSIWVHYQVSNC